MRLDTLNCSCSRTKRDDHGATAKPPRDFAWLWIVAIAAAAAEGSAWVMRVTAPAAIALRRRPCRGPTTDLMAVGILTYVRVRPFEKNGSDLVWAGPAQVCVHQSLHAAGVWRNNNPR